MNLIYSVNQSGNKHFHNFLQLSWRTWWPTEKIPSLHQTKTYQIVSNKKTTKVLGRSRTAPPKVFLTVQNYLEKIEIPGRGCVLLPVLSGPLPVWKTMLESQLKWKSCIPSWQVKVTVGIPGSIKSVPMPVVPLTKGILKGDHVIRSWSFPVLPRYLESFVANVQIFLV